MNPPLSSDDFPDDSKAPPKASSVATKLGWVSFFNDCSGEALTRTLPLILIGPLGSSPFYLGFIEGIAEALSIFLKGFSGWLSDRLPSRKPIVVTGYSLSLISRALLAFLTLNPLVIALTRFLDKTGKGLRAAPRDALIADEVVLGLAGRDFGVARFLDTLGAIVSLLMVYFLAFDQGKLSVSAMQKTALLGLPFGILAIALLQFWIPNFIRQTPSKKYISVIIPKRIRPFLGIIFVFSIGKSSEAFLMLKAQDLGFSFPQILLLWVFFSFVTAGLAVPLGRLSDRLGRIPILVTGWLLFALAYFMFGISSTKSEFWLGMILYGIYYGCTDGIEKALLSDLLPTEERGTGYGSLQFVLGLAALPASATTGILMSKYGIQSAMLTSAFFAVLGTGSLLIWNFKWGTKSIIG
jgi:MFS family permease